MSFTISFGLSLEMDRWLTVLVVFPKDSSSVSSTRLGASYPPVIPVPGDLMPFSDLHGNLLEKAKVLREPKSMWKALSLQAVRALKQQSLKLVLLR